MAHIVTEPCIGCLHADCVNVCPVDCFHQDTNMLLIDPFECIDCGACIPECPEEAIFTDDTLPDEWQAYTTINAEKAPGLPVITNSGQVPPFERERHCQ